LCRVGIIPSNAGVAFEKILFHPGPCTIIQPQETLEKMRERIEISSNNYEGPDLLIQQRMEELKVSDP